MAMILPFDSIEAFPAQAFPKARTYSVDISAFPEDYIEFTVNGVKVEAKSLCKIADELEKIASIIRSDVITDVIKA